MVFEVIIFKGSCGVLVFLWADPCCCGEAAPLSISTKKEPGKDGKKKRSPERFWSLGVQGVTCSSTLPLPFKISQLPSEREQKVLHVQ